MAPRMRFTIGSVLWAILLFAVCTSWIIQWTRNRWISESEWRVFEGRGQDLRFALQVNQELRDENKALRAKLRANGLRP